MRLKIEFSYNGKLYNGYQKQAKGETIQGELEWAMSQFFETNLTIKASGRTDAGVSAIKQVAHMDIEEELLLKKIKKVSDRELDSLAIRINYLLTDDVKILKFSRVSDDFHARFEPKSKTYCYNFYLSKVEIPYLSQFCLWVKDNSLNIDFMNKALQQFIGTHDFSAFCASNTEVVDKVRTITDAKMTYNDLGFYTISIKGNGFLYNMVRIIVGTLIDVGRGNIKYTDISNIIASKDRAKAGKTVSADGLVLKCVDY